jgi:hypothetical protein
LPSVQTRAIAISPDGQEEIFAQNGSFRITLDGARCYGECIIGGPPIIVNVGSVVEDQINVFGTKMLEDVTIPTDDPLGMNGNQNLETPTPTIVPTTEATKVLQSPTPGIIEAERPILGQTPLAFVTPENPVVEVVDQNFDEITPPDRVNLFSLPNISGLWFIALAFIILILLMLLIVRARQS